MLDNVIDINYYAVKKARDSNMRHRPVGMGVMAFQDSLYSLRIPYASDAAVAFADTSMEAICYYAYWASSDLAKERGRYASRNTIQTTTLLDAIEEFKFDDLSMGAVARAKARDKELKRLAAEIKRQDDDDDDSVGSQLAAQAVRVTALSKLPGTSSEGAWLTKTGLKPEEKKKKEALVLPIPDEPTLDRLTPMEVNMIRERVVTLEVRDASYFSPRKQFAYDTKMPVRNLGGGVRFAIKLSHLLYNEQDLDFDITGQFLKLNTMDSSDNIELLIQGYDSQRFTGDPDVILDTYSSGEFWDDRKKCSPKKRGRAPQFKIQYHYVPIRYGKTPACVLLYCEGHFWISEAATFTLASITHDGTPSIHFTESNLPYMTTVSYPGPYNPGDKTWKRIKKNIHFRTLNPVDVMYHAREQGELLLLTASLGRGQTSWSFLRAHKARRQLSFAD